MPASLIIEGLAQTGGILVGEAGGFAEKVVLAKIPRAEFFGVACAGDQLVYEVTLTDLRAEGAVVSAKAFLEGELLAEVEIVFAHLDNTRSNQIFGPKNFVFTQQLLGVLDLAKASEPGPGGRQGPSLQGRTPNGQAVLWSGLTLRRPGLYGRGTCFRVSFIVLGPPSADVESGVSSAASRRFPTVGVRRPSHACSAPNAESSSPVLGSSVRSGSVPTPSGPRWPRVAGVSTRSGRSPLTACRPTVGEKSATST